MDKLTVKFVDGAHSSYDVENLIEMEMGISFDVLDAFQRNHFFIPYTSILFTNYVIGE